MIVSKAMNVLIFSVQNLKRTLAGKNQCIMQGIFAD